VRAVILEAQFAARLYVIDDIPHGAIRIFIVLG
jgi:hypothetical protein